MSLASTLYYTMATPCMYYSYVEYTYIIICVHEYVAKIGTYSSKDKNFIPYILNPGGIQTVLHHSCDMKTTYHTEKQDIYCNAPI